MRDKRGEYTWGRNLGEKLGRNVREEIESAGTTENAEEPGTWGARHCGDYAGALLAYLPTNLNPLYIVTHISGFITLPSYHAPPIMPV